jgi:hypothetical protein
MSVRAGAWVAALAAFVALATVNANNKDLFNYDYPNDSVPGGGGTDYGQPDWGKVTCDDLDVCVSTRALLMQTADCVAPRNAVILTSAFPFDSLDIPTSFSVLTSPQI